MSRALNIDVPLDEVTAACAKHGAGISTIEKLPGGCTRVVLLSADGAAIIQRLYRTKIVTKPLARVPLSIASRGVPMTQELPPKPAPPANFSFRRF